MIYCINIHWKCGQLMQYSKRNLGHEKTSSEINYMDENLQAHNFTKDRCEVWLLVYCQLGFLDLSFFILSSFPLPAFGFYSIWFKIVLLGIRLQEKRLQDSSLAQQMFYPWTTYTMKTLLLRATKKRQGFVEVGIPAVQYKLFIG